MFLVGVGVVALLLLAFLNWHKHNYWKSKGIFAPTCIPFLGHAYNLLFGAYRWEYIDQIYVKNKSKGFWGMYELYNPVLFISDPSLVRDILVRDADCFLDRRTMKMSKKDKVLSELLIVLRGEKWKALRSIITPTFSAGKIKSMFPLITDKGDKLISYCRDQMYENSFIDMRSAFGLYAMDVISTCAFGIDANCLGNKKSEFIKNAVKVVSFDIIRMLKFIVFVSSSKLYEILGLEFGGKPQHFFIEIAQKAIAERKESGKKRGDFLDLMLEALQNCTEQENFKYPMSVNTVVSQSLLFLLVGYDTTLNTLSVVSYSLAKNQNCQSRLREELQKIVDSDGELTYHNIMEAKYLDACISESLRLYSIVHVTERCCTKRYRLHGTDYELSEGMIVSVPIWSIHRDPDYWQEPLKFLPDRFLPENKGNIKPYTYMPFGLGPRNCVGMKFAQLEAKTALAKLCLKFQMTLQPGYENLVFDDVAITLRPGKDGVRLVLKEI